MRDEGKRKILLCLYPFPPLGGPRSYRWLNLTQVLSQRNWDVDVLTIRPSPNDSFYEPSLSKELPSFVHVYRTFPGLYYSLYHMRTHPSRGFPKTTLEWLPFGFRKGRNLLKKNHYQVLISSGLPFVGHLLGYLLQRKARIPWIADYGDPFAFNPMTSRSKRLVGGAIENHILKKAAGLVVPCEEMQREFLDFYPFLKEIPKGIIGSGIPKKFKYMPPASFHQKFTISYIGNFYKGDREPYEFFQALNLLKDHPDFMDHLNVVMAGNIEKKYIRYAQRLNISSQIQFLGRIPQEKSFSVLKGTTIILIIGSRWTYYHFPYKMAECVASSKPILAIKQSPKDLGVDFIQKNNLGWIIPNHKTQIARSLKKLFVLWKEKKLEYSFNQLSPENFFWETKGKQLEEFIEKII